MHIVHILPELKQGGVETVVLGLNREQVKSGHSVTVISAGGKLEDQITKDGGNHIALNTCSKNPLTLPIRIQKMRHMLSALHPDIIHVHSRVPAWIAWFANRKLKIPFITTVHGFNSISRYSAIMTKGDRVICVSNPVKDYIAKHYSVNAEKIRVVHGGIDPSQFNPENIQNHSIESLRERFRLEEKKVISAIGRITELKDYETFIRAISTAHAENPDLSGLIVGHVRHDKQDYFERLTRLISDLQLNNVLHIATDVTDIPAVYAVSDLVVSCSKKPESFGLTLIEALAMNTPVIATRHGGPLDIIVEGQNGAFFSPQSPGDLAVKINEWINHQPQNFRASTIRTFNLKNMANANLSVYAEVLNNA